MGWPKPCEIWWPKLIWSCWCSPTSTTLMQNWNLQTVLLVVKFCKLATCNAVGGLEAFFSLIRQPLLLEMYFPLLRDHVDVVSLQLSDCPDLQFLQWKNLPAWFCGLVSETGLYKTDQKSWTAVQECSHKFTTNEQVENL